jgi:hypothetical protein
MRTHSTVLIAATLLIACEADPRVGARAAPDAGVPAGTFSSIAQDVLVPLCATSACHAGGIPPLNAPVNLELENAYDQLVNVPSEQQPTMELVAPGDPEGSYLLNKLRYGDPLCVGQVMPPSGQLDDATIAAIEAWIREGAQP